MHTLENLGFACDYLRELPPKDFSYHIFQTTLNRFPIDYPTKIAQLFLVCQVFFRLTFQVFLHVAKFPIFGANGAWSDSEI